MYDSTGSDWDVDGPVLVEAFGAPGAGKTTLVRGVVEALPDDVAVAQPTLAINETLETPRRQLAKLPYVARGLGRAPRDPLRYAAAARTDARPSLCFNWLYAAGAVDRSARRSRVTVFDQAIVQAYWSIALSESAAVERAFRRRLRAVIPPVAYVLVCVRASPDVVADRLDERDEPQSRVGADEPETPSVADAVETTETVRTVATRLAANRPGLSVCTVEGDEPADRDAGVERVVRLVHRAANGTSHRKEGRLPSTERPRSGYRR